MDKRWRNLIGLIVIIVFIFLFLNLNNIIKQPLLPVGEDISGSDLNATEKDFLKISEVFENNDLNVQKIRYLDNMAYSGDSAFFSSDESSLLKVKNELIEIKESDQTSAEGKSVANIYINAVDFLIFEKKLTTQMKDLEKLASLNSCENVDLMIDANKLIFQRYEQVENLYDLVQIHSAEYDWTSEVIVIDYEREEASLFVFADEVNAFIESCSGDSV